MKRRFWIAGTSRRSGWLVAAACAGLAATWSVGAFVLLPQIDPRDLPLAALLMDEPEPVAASIEAVVESGPTVIDRGPAAVAPVELGAPAMPAADACVAAMDAALANARIEFLSASVEIVPASRNVISVLAALAHACPGRIEIAGHSDDLGRDEVNRQISIARAQAVADAFVEFGLAADRLTVVGFGSTRPVADNATSAGRARNRRIEMSLLVDALSAERGKEP